MSKNPLFKAQETDNTGLSKFIPRLSCAMSQVLPGIEFYQYLILLVY